MKRRKILAPLIALLLIATSFSACGNKATQQEGTDSPQTSSGVASEQDAEEPKASSAEGATILWAFAQTHATYFEWVGEEYKKEQPDFELVVEVMGAAALNDRLSVIITSGGEGSPDLVDIEQGQFPRYMFEDKMCFEPLNSWLERDKIAEQMVESRLSLYKYDGNYYGLEHALTPVTMAYRPDLFEENGIAIPTTWDEYKDAAAKFKEKGIYIASHEDMRILSGLGQFELWLKSAGLDIADEQGELNITPELKMLMEDFRMMQQEGMVYAYETDAERWVPFLENKVATFLTPDWAAGWLRDNVPEQSGQWAMTYMPKLTPDSARTSCWGGTGLAIMQDSPKDKENLWEFLKFSQVKTENSVKKYELINLYPPVYEAMPLCNGPVEYFGGQVLGEMYQELSKEMPVQNQAPWRGMFNDICKTYFFDFYEGNISVDEFFDSATADLNNQM